MANKVQIKRGSKANLPTLSDGELAFCKDTAQLYIGNGSGNILLNAAGAPIDSPAFMGIPTAPTPPTSTYSTQLATTAFVKSQGYVSVAGEAATTTGGYVKYSNGVMICWDRKDFGMLSIGSAYGTLYRSSEFTFNNFPVSFYYAPAVSIDSRNVGGNISGSWIVKSTTSTDSVMTNPGTFFFVSPNSGSLLDAYATYVAVGYWKKCN